MATRKKTGITAADAAKMIAQEGSEKLAETLAEWAKDDALLRDRLILYAARRSGPEAGVAAVRRAFEKAVRVHGFLHYRQAGAWARNVNRAIDSIAQLLEDAQDAAVIELCEAGLESLVDAVQSIDDSDGHFGILRDRLQDIHYQACLEGDPNPIELAKRLFRLELTGDFDVFDGAAERYAKILGATGLKAYRELAEAEWAKVPARTGKESASAWSEHFRITRIMESLAQASGDVEQRVAVLSRDLSSGYHYWQIAEIYREAGLHAKALEWAEAGIRASPAHTDSRLLDFAASEYQRRGRHDDAMKLAWTEFMGSPFVGAYEKLERRATLAGTWPEWRERALDEIRRRIAKTKAERAGQRQPFCMREGADHSALVEIFLYEGRAEEAWREGREGGCSENLWMRLAGLREKEHPEDAAPIYLKYAEAKLTRVNNGRYEEAVDLLANAAAAMKRMDRSSEFETHLQALRTKFKAKRNFTALVERRRNELYLPLG